MTDQLRAFTPGPADGNLSDDQHHILTILHANPEGMRTLDIGRALHLEGRYQCRTCNQQRTCDFASPHALRVLGQLGTPTTVNPRGRGLVVRRKTGLWQLVQPLVRSGGRDSGEIPY
jgi:hypothetical protein